MPGLRFHSHEVCYVLIGEETAKYLLASTSNSNVKVTNVRDVRLSYVIDQGTQEPHAIPSCS